MNIDQPRDFHGRWTDAGGSGGHVGLILKAVRLKDVEWLEDGKRAKFQNPGYGVQNTDGRFLSFDGVRPYSVSKKSTADEVARTLTDSEQNKWITPLSTPGVSGSAVSGRSVADKILDALAYEDQLRKEHFVEALQRAGRRRH